MYIIMKLIYIGILFILIIIIQIYKIIEEKEKIVKESFNMVKKYKNEEKFRKDSIRYYRNLGDKKVKNILGDLSYAEFNDFLMLDSKDVLIPYNDIYIEGYSNMEGYTNNLSPTKKKVKDCREIKSCSELATRTDCGYCGTTNKFDYNMGDDVAPDVCPDHKTRGRMWANGGRVGVNDCRKIKEQLLCDTVKNCVAMEKGTKIGRLCGWCPGDSKAKVKTSAGLLKYPHGNERNQTKIRGDTCKDLGVADPHYPHAVWFDKLIDAGNCPECEKPDENGNPRGANGPHSDACIDSLWKAGYTYKKNSAQCQTSFKDVVSGASHYGSYTNRRTPYYKLSSQMKRDVNLPIIFFQKDYNNTPSWDQPREKPPRRKYNVYSIDRYFKRCFGKNRKDKLF